MKTWIVTCLAMSAFIGKAAQSTNAPASSMAGRLGVGITLGEPIGPDVKYFFTDTFAIDGALGWSAHDHSEVYFHADALWHCHDLINLPGGRTSLYYGVGGLFRARNHDLDNEVGIRVPIGLSYMFEKIPVDIFAEVGPALDVAPFVRGEVTGGVGARFWF